ncbi:hypothetical protein [Robbsia andropogonis]|uniref:hypothetical protein n=1 Tax=Robbsia andropogonis TaxID=28092 RepID=UPI00209D6C64|nr:hypothetical protein [Robbsia andropogonis]MCP1118718.1 hypothetical protein [Robbsia andropogonis]MCP1128185.1 hypothetical protein [Robbsia andropogonis]
MSGVVAGACGDGGCGGRLFEGNNTRLRLRHGLTVSGVVRDGDWVSDLMTVDAEEGDGGGDGDDDIGIAEEAGSGLNDDERLRAGVSIEDGRGVRLGDGSLSGVSLAGSSRTPADQNGDATVQLEFMLKLQLQIGIHGGVF